MVQKAEGSWSKWTLILMLPSYGLQMGPEIFYRMFSRLVDYGTIFAHGADSR